MFSKILTFLEMIRFEHTLFALPFAYIGTFLAAHGWPGIEKFVWITLAMVGARTAGMCFNRLIDLSHDAQNPRTKNRALVSGKFSRGATWFIAFSGIALLLLAAGQLNPLCLALSPIAVLLLFSYSFFKRFSSASHFALGAVLACAPVGGWIAVTGSFALPPLLLSASVILWVAGFDMLYALQDIEFDRKVGLFSIPSRFGKRNAIFIALACHVGTLILLSIAGRLLTLGLWYDTGLFIFGALLSVQYVAFLRRSDAAVLNRVWFRANALGSVTIFLFTMVDLFAKRL